MSGEPVPDDASLVELTYRRLARHPFRVDALCSALAAAGLVLLAVPSALSSAAWLPTLGMIVALAWRRRQPVRSAVAVAGFGLILLADRESTFLPICTICVFCALYAITAYGPHWGGWAGALVAWAGGVAMMLAVEVVRVERADLVFGLTFLSTLVFGVWALGRMRRLRLRDGARLAERARLLESEARQQAQLAATAERARIAREMHDVVAHSLSVTISQADGGRYAARHNPESAIPALETIAANGRQALADMRALLGVLRDDTTGQLTPQPDTATIEDLLDQVRGSGLRIDLAVEGEPVTLPTGPGLAAYRIVQESLTNVLKHAGPAATATVRLTWLAQELLIRVEDTGRGAGAVASSPGGQGLVGMRERAALYGGQLEAGPRVGGGFGVSARLPYGLES